MITNFRALIEALTDEEVHFVVIGGVALVAQGAPRTTVDLDICYARDDENLKRLAAALAPLAPYLRDVPEGLPFSLDAATLRAGLNFTLTTTEGDLDLLGEVVGLGGFEALIADSLLVRLYDRDVRLLSLDQLERAKRAAGRIKDLSDLAHIHELKKRK